MCTCVCACACVCVCVCLCLFTFCHLEHEADSIIQMLPFCFISRYVGGVRRSDANKPRPLQQVSGTCHLSRRQGRDGGWGASVEAAASAVFVGVLLFRCEGGHIWTSWLRPLCLATDVKQSCCQSPVGRCDWQVNVMMSFPVLPAVMTRLHHHHRST